MNNWLRGLALEKKRGKLQEKGWGMVRGSLKKRRPIDKPYQK